MKAASLFVMLLMLKVDSLEPLLEYRGHNE